MNLITDGCRNSMRGCLMRLILRQIPAGSCKETLKLCLPLSQIEEFNLWFCMFLSQLSCEICLKLQIERRAHRFLGPNSEGRPQGSRFPEPACVIQSNMHANLIYARTQWPVCVQEGGRERGKKAASVCPLCQSICHGKSWETEHRQPKVYRLVRVFYRGWYLNICIINPISVELSEERENTASPVEKRAL